MTRTDLRIFALALATAMLSGAAPASAMTADEFLTRAQTLKGKGMMAVFHKKEINALLEEVKSASQAYKADHDRALAAGDPSLGCPPAPGSKGAKYPRNRMSTDQFLGHFAGIPKEQRQRMTFKAAYYDLIRARFPCSAK